MRDPRSTYAGPSCTLPAPTAANSCPPADSQCTHTAPTVCVYSRTCRQLDTRLDAHNRVGRRGRDSKAARGAEPRRRVAAVRAAGGLCPGSDDQRAALDAHIGRAAGVHLLRRAGKGRELSETKFPPSWSASVLLLIIARLSEKRSTQSSTRSAPAMMRANVWMLTNSLFPLQGRGKGNPCQRLECVLPRRMPSAAACNSQWTGAHLFTCKGTAVEPLSAARLTSLGCQRRCRPPAAPPTCPRLAPCR